ncbi:MAG: helix-hairpin-helix domain-containing protein [Acidimicrobiia bacterium]|nr:helix-hairpin-helix domain-containing protein [Acidimicrobiia bacterium]
MIRPLLAVAALAVITAAAPVASAQESSRQAARPAVSDAAPINLNTATATELEKLPGVGPATALRIVEFRTKNGAFKKVEDLMSVRGIGEKTFLTLKPLVSVAPPKGMGW